MNKRRLKFIELALWIGVVASGVLVASIITGFVIGGGLLTSKYIMFIVGSLMVGLGVLGIQPKSPYKDQKRISVEGASETRFESAIQELPPIDDVVIPFDQRIGRHPKVLLAGLIVLLVSLVLEFVLGVKVG